MTFRLLKTAYHKKHGADRICFTHHPHSVICSSIHNLDLHGGDSLWINFWFCITWKDILTFLLPVCCQNLCGTYPCMIIDAFVTLRDIKRGRVLFPWYLSLEWLKNCAFSVEKLGTDNGLPWLFYKCLQQQLHLSHKQVL